MTPEQAERQRRSFAYGNVKIENDSITWEMIDRAAEEFEKEKSAGGVLLVWAGGFAVPEFICVAYGTTEVVPFHEPRGRELALSKVKGAPAPHQQVLKDAAQRSTMGTPARIFYFFA